MSETTATVLILLLIAVVAIVIVGWGFGKSTRDTLTVFAIVAVLIAVKVADSPGVRKLLESPPVAELHKAAAGGDAVRVRRIIADDATNVNAKNIKGWTPLHSAAKGGYIEIASDLVIAGAKLHARTIFRQTPLDIAIEEHGKESDIALFLQKEIQPPPPPRQNIRKEKTNPPPPFRQGVIKPPPPSSRQPPRRQSRKKQDYNRSRIQEVSMRLHNAAAAGNVVEARRMISDGANVNAKNTSGWTPLHWAAEGGHTGVAHTLVKAGADLHARTNRDKTPLDIAKQAHGKDSEIALFLQGEMKPTPPFRQSRRYQNKRQN